MKSNNTQPRKTREFATERVINAVIGYPLEHSRSPLLHNPVYKMLKLDAVLSPISHPSIKKLVKDIRALPIHLTAVTMPFKQTIIPLLDTVDGEAKAVGAVNTVVNRNGKLHGYNTDSTGIEYALRGVALRGSNVLLLGAGGAANAVAYVIKKHGGNLLYLNRTKEKAEALRALFGGLVVQESELNADGIDVIVNATPLGMYPKTAESPLSPKLLRKSQVVFDLVYNPMDTKLLRDAKKKGAKAISGIDMFVVQGLRQIELWTGKKVITLKMVEQIKKRLQKELK